MLVNEVYSMVSPPPSPHSHPKNPKIRQFVSPQGVSAVLVSMCWHYDMSPYFKCHQYLPSMMLVSSLSSICESWPLPLDPY